MLHKLGFIWAELAFGISIGINVKSGRRLIIEHLDGIVVNNDAVNRDDMITRQALRCETDACQLQTRLQS